MNDLVVHSNCVETFSGQFIYWNILVHFSTVVTLDLDS
jgi:hypothetical protein